MTAIERVYQAYIEERGCRLSADEVDELFHDDAIETRLINTMAGWDVGAADPRMRTMKSLAEARRYVKENYPSPEPTP